MFQSRLVLPLIVLLSCGGSDTTSDLDASQETLEAGDLQHKDADVLEVVKPYVSARRVTSGSDLTEGDNAYGLVNKSYVIENSFVRFVIQDKDVSAHLSLYGGNLIDADLRRKDGEEGHEQFREMFPVVGFRTQMVDKIEIAKDGSDGEAIIRVYGKDAPLGMIPLLDNMASPLNVEIVTDYILHPFDRFITIKTEVKNLDPKPIGNLLVGDFLAFGGGSRVMSPESGFTGTPSVVSMLASTGRGASYGYCAKGDFTVPLVDASGTVAILDYDLGIPPNGSVIFERYFFVGDGDIDSVFSNAMKVKGVKLLRVTGFVIDPDGNPIESAIVSAMKAGQSAHTVNQSIVRGGKYVIHLPPNKYDLIFSAEGHNRVVLKDVTLTVQDENIDVKMGALGVVKLEVFESDPKGKEIGKIPCKVSFYCKEGTEEPMEEIGEWKGKGLCNVIFSKDGTGKFPIKPGKYRVVVSRGIEYELVEKDIEVISQKETVISASLVRSLNTSGYISTDLHQHTIGSIDGPLTHEEKVIENLAEGVEYPACTDHDNVTSYHPAIKGLQVSEYINGINGDEVSPPMMGHFNMFSPELEPDTYEYIGAKFYSKKSVTELFQDMRNIKGVKLIQINHPRDGDKGYLNYIGFDPITGKGLVDDLAEGFDLIEVKDSIGEPKLFLEIYDEEISKNSGTTGNIPVMKDWFAMLNMGLKVTGVANSDAHGRNDGVGYGRNFVRIGGDNPKDVSSDQIMDSLKAQKVVVSNGPFIRVTVDGKEFMGYTEPVKVKDKLLMHIRVEAVSWIDTTQMVIYKNGRPIFLKDIMGVLTEDEQAKNEDKIGIPLKNEGIVRGEWDVVLFPKENTWYVIVVRGNKGLEPVGRGFPFAYTNPIYVKVEGDELMVRR